MVEQQDREVKPHQEEMEVMNLSGGKEKKEVKVGTCMSTSIQDELVALLRDFQDTSSDIVQHQLTLNPECSSIKQKLGRMKPEMPLQLKEEVKKKFDAGFLPVA